MTICRSKSHRHIQWNVVMTLRSFFCQSGKQDSFLTFAGGNAVVLGLLIFGLLGLEVTEGQEHDGTRVSGAGQRSLPEARTGRGRPGAGGFVGGGGGHGRSVNK